MSAAEADELEVAVAAQPASVSETESGKESHWIELMIEIGTFIVGEKKTDDFPDILCV
jgi:hypothetical protein